MTPTQTVRFSTLCAALFALAACGETESAVDSENAVIDPPAQCAPDRPDCSISVDQPVASDLNAENSAGIRYSNETGSLVIDRVTSLPDADGDGVPDDADDCPGTPDWISCDDDPSNDGLYQTAFYDPSGADEVVRSSTVSLVAEIPKVDIYFLIDATPTLAEEIAELQAEILNIIGDILLSFPDARFGLGLYRAYPLAPLAAAYSQAPYHHILDFTDDVALVETAVSTLNTVQNGKQATAATQALYSVASGLGLADTVPNRGACPDAPVADIGYPCFRDGALHLVMNITDAEVFNGPRLTDGSQYDDEGFMPGDIPGADTLPPVEMFPQLFDADTAALALDLGDLSSRSLTLMGMSTLLNDRVNTAMAPGCDTVSGMPPGADMDGKDVVLKLRFDSISLGEQITVRADNTHWPAANVAVFDDAALDPAMALACDGGTVGVGLWGEVVWPPSASLQYYLVADGIIPAADPGLMPEGAFSISILRSGDLLGNPAWLTSAAPVAWADVEAVLGSSNIRVASVVTLRDAMSMTSAGTADASAIALATDARTRFGAPWLTELTSSIGEGLGAAIGNTIALAKDDSVYDISMVDLDNDATAIDETELIAQIVQTSCAEGQALGCASGTANECRNCELGAAVEYQVLFSNTTVEPTSSSQVFDFEIVVWADDVVEVERIPVRVMVPDAAAHVFDDTPAAAFYRNAYDSTERCDTPPERPRWGELRWEGSTPSDSSIEFQIRTAASLGELPSAIPLVISASGSAVSGTFNVSEELIAAGQTFGLPYIQITAVLNPSNSPPTTPTLLGWTFEFICEPAE